MTETPTIYRKEPRTTAAPTTRHTDGMTAERWRPIPGFEGAYEISSEGRVSSVRRLSAATNRWGPYVRRIGGWLLRPNPTGWVTLCDDDGVYYARVADLVHEAFGLLTANRGDCQQTQPSTERNAAQHGVNCDPTNLPNDTPMYEPVSESNSRNLTLAEAAMLAGIGRIRRRCNLTLAEAMRMCR